MEKDKLIEKHERQIKEIEETVNALKENMKKLSEKNNEKVFFSRHFRRNFLSHLSQSYISASLWRFFKCSSKSLFFTNELPQTLHLTPDDPFWCFFKLFVD